MCRKWEGPESHHRKWVIILYVSGVFIHNDKNSMLINSVFRKTLLLQISSEEKEDNGSKHHIHVFLKKVQRVLRWEGV